jgi:flagellar protein FliL
MAATAEATEADAAPLTEEQIAAAKKKKLMLFGGVGVAVLLAAGGGGYFYISKKKAAEAAMVNAPKPIAFVDMKEMVVNLALEPNQERARIIKFKVSLEVNDAMMSTNITPLMPRLEDLFQIYIRELRPSDLEGSAGTYRLSRELLKRVNIAVHPQRVEAVLFRELVVQ